MRVIIGAIAGGIALFIWAFVSWMFIPWHRVQPLTGKEAAVKQALSGFEGGVYAIPGPTIDVTAEQQAAAEEAWTAAHRAGPLALVVYEPQGNDPLGPMRMGIGLGLEIALALVAAIMLHVVGPAVPFYRQRVGFVFLLGVFAVVGSHLMNWHWFSYPLRWTLESIGDGLAGALLLGLVLGAIVKPGGHVVLEEVTAF